MLSRCTFAVLALALAWGGDAVAQNRVRTETITPPAAPAAPPVVPPAAAPAAPPTGPNAQVAPPVAPPTRPTGRIPSAQTLSTPPEIITDLKRLPAAVARTRERILAAARSGDLNKVLTVMQMNETMPVFSFSEDKDPAAFWKTNYPDSEGVEVLSILIEILEAGFVHVETGTPQEMYLWPYFARLPLKNLTAEQRVELFKFVTGSDFKEMQDFGAYIFFRLGIGPDGTWHFFVAGD